MQSGAEEEWDDEDWDDMDDSSTSAIRHIEQMPLFTNMRIAIGVSLVILLLLCSMVFTNFGLYYGASHVNIIQPKVGIIVSQIVRVETHDPTEFYI